MTRGAIIYYIYNVFKNDLFYEMKRHKLEKCKFCDYYDYQNDNLDYGIFYFQAINMLGNNHTCKISVIIDKSEYEYEYYDKLVDTFKSHADWIFEIGEYDHNTDTFDIIFKRCIFGVIEEQSYGISSFGIIMRVRKRDVFDEIADYMDLDARSVCETIYAHILSMGQMSIPILSKPPIFNPPATICYWTDGTKTVVKCQKGDTYSPEAGLALCYMKKVLGNTSKDLNKELHKYIHDEKED